jgi:uncharacterized protein (TIGR03066 family)
MKTKIAFVALACFALCVSACNSSPQDRLLGKWEAGQSGVKLAVEFAKDGKAKITLFGKTLQGTYKVTGGDELEWTMNGMTTKCKIIKVTGTELELTQDGKTITYKKV